MFKKLIDKYPAKMALSMEMFQTDCQTVLNEYLAGFIREKNLITEGRAWKNYKDYRPMVDDCKDQHICRLLPLMPLLATPIWLPALGLGRFAKAGCRGQKHGYLPCQLILLQAAYYEKFGNHYGRPQRHGRLLKIYQSQNLWDATMGYSIAKFYKANKGIKIFQVNGGFHSEEKLGTVAQLKKYAPGIKVINIQAYADNSFDNPGLGQVCKFGDYIILTDPKLPKTF
jgi:uncharacterized iron-regulated protein